MGTPTVEALRSPWGPKLAPSNTPLSGAPGASPWPSQNPIFSSVAPGDPPSPPPAKGASKQDHLYLGEGALQERGGLNIHRATLFCEKTPLSPPLREPEAGCASGPAGSGEGGELAGWPRPSGLKHSDSRAGLKPRAGCLSCRPRSHKNTEGARLSLQVVTRDEPLPKTWPCHSSHRDGGREGGSTGGAGRKDKLPHMNQALHQERQSKGTGLLRPSQRGSSLTPPGQAGGTASGADSARGTPQPTSPRVLVCPEHWEHDGGSGDRWPRLGQARLESD